MSMDAKKLYALALNPWVIIGSLAAGFLVGTYFPKEAVKLGFLGDIYVDLLKMITLPFMVFMVSAVIFSLQRLFREGGTGKLLGRLTVVFFVFSVAVAVVGAATLLVLRPGRTSPAPRCRRSGRSWATT
jgi:Na+/H+-dicarboxylate symporter